MVETKRIRLQSKGNCDIIDITAEVERDVAASSMDSGTATLFVVGSTAGLTTVEYEPGLVADLKSLFDRIVSPSIVYQHDERWHDGNGHSHVRASLLGPSLVVPFAGKRLTLGTWQQIVFIDFDIRPRSREIVVQLMGE